MYNKFKIQGPYDKDDRQPLYWSNEDGWVDFQSATIFTANQRINLPMGTEFVAWLNGKEQVDSLMNETAYYSM